MDAKFLPPNERQPNKFLPEAYVGENLSLEETLRYRYLLSLEGVDVDGDLLWKLFSNSVVFMPNVTTYVSWSMETALEPWVHFVPIDHADLSDLESKIRWADNHPHEARAIAERSTLFVYDLLFHRDALSDDMDIMQTMMHRYEQYILRAKPILQWSHVWDRITSNADDWYSWFIEDWLRIAFLVSILLFGCL